MIPALHIEKKKNKKNNLQTNKKQQREIRFHLKHDKIC